MAKRLVNRAIIGEACEAGFNIMKLSAPLWRAYLPYFSYHWRDSSDTMAAGVCRAIARPEEAGRHVDFI